MDMKISSIDLDLLNFKQISVFNQSAATPSHSVPSLPKIGKMHQYEIHITTRVFFLVELLCWQTAAGFFIKSREEEDYILTFILTGRQFFPQCEEREKRHVPLPVSVNPSVPLSVLTGRTHWHQRAKKRMRTTIMMVTSTPIAHHCLRPEEHTDL